MSNASCVGVRTDNETFRSTHAFFTWDHRRLEGQHAEISRLVEAGELDRARRLFAHYERGMRRHMRIEEEVIFLLQAFERTGAARAPGPMFAEEHVKIVKLVEEMGAGLTEEDVPRFRAAHAELAAFLPGHMEREESAIYPYIDSLVGTAEAEHIVERLRAE
jgi:regulator of cell morphogenesis and NO signaling